MRHSAVLVFANKQVHAVPAGGARGMQGAKGAAHALCRTQPPGTSNTPLPASACLLTHPPHRTCVTR